MTSMDQRSLAAAGFDIAWWFGVRCEKCCGLYPRLIVENTSDAMCWYECDVCGRRGAKREMPWQAERAWNDGEIVFEGQPRLFGLGGE